MSKIYIILLALFSTISYARTIISDKNPAVIRQVSIKGEIAKLSLQVIADGFAQLRCMCPESTFAANVRENNGSFNVYVKKSWLEESYPQLLKDKDYLPNLYSNNQSVLIVYDSQLAFVRDENKSISSYRAIKMAGGSIIIGKYTADRNDRFSLEQPLSSRFIPTDTPIQNNNESSHEGNAYIIHSSNPAALLAVEIQEDKVHLELQIINSSMPIARCICATNTFSAAINENNGKFNATMSLELFQKYLPELVEDPNLISKKYTEKSELYIFAGKLNLQLEGISKVIGSEIVEVKLIQAVQYTKESEDAFSFNGPTDRSYYYTTDGDNEDDLSNSFNDIMK
ncbi:MAG: hypothetical protein COB02_05060 [Candidatus Cloacimonadota bacterium]|nr:MAG: hypothetical protein COB02_05060 [Candidatus Cloacimonadota bacterium]